MDRTRAKLKKRLPPSLAPPIKKQLNYPGLFLILVCMVSIGAGMTLLLNKVGAALTNFLANQLEINDFYVDKLVGFSLLFITSPLFLIFLILEGDQRRVRKFFTKYISQLVVKDYYKQSHINIEGQIVLTPEADDSSQRAAASVRPQASEIEAKYIRGELNGSFKEFFPNGNLKREICYINGKKNGLFRTFYETSQIEQEAVYKDDNIEGTYRSYYEDGTLHQEKNYDQGKLNGVYKACDEQGIPFFEISFKNNLQHGPDKVYDKMGVLQFVDEYREGILVNRKTYDEFGTLRFDQDFHDNIAIASWIEAEEKTAKREAEEHAKRWGKKKTPDGA